MTGSNNSTFSLSLFFNEFSDSANMVSSVANKLLLINDVNKLLLIITK